MAFYINRRPPPAGVANQTVSPPVATASASAPAPTIALSIGAPVATAAASAPLPTIQLRVSPPAASAAASAPTPTVQVGIPVPVATASANGPPPTVTTAALVSPGAATANASAPTPTIQLQVSPPAATAAASAPIPTPQLSIPAPAATAAASSQPGGHATPAVRLFPGVSTASASAPIPLVTAAPFVFPPAATASASAPTPIVDVKVSPPAATASASAKVPTVTTAIIVAPPSATASASAPTPTVSGSAFATPPHTRATHATGRRGTTGTHGNGGATTTEGVGGLTSSTGTSGQTSTRRRHFQPTQVCTLAYAPQEVSPDVATLEALLGRRFTGARRNSALSTHTWTQNQNDYDAGYRINFRNANAQTTNPSPPPSVLPMGWSTLAAGTYDTSDLKPLADNLQSDPRWTSANPIILCYHHEQTVDTTNQAGFPTNGTAQQYIDSSRHWSDYFESRGLLVYSKLGVYNPAGKILRAHVVYQGEWLDGTIGQQVNDFDPNLGSSPAPSGTSYYDLFGADVYNNINAGVLKYGTSAATMLDGLVSAARARNKNFIIPEFGCDDDGLGGTISVAKAAWYDSVRLYLDSLGSAGPGVCKFIGFTAGIGARLYTPTSSAQASAAFARFGGDGYYA